MINGYCGLSLNEKSATILREEALETSKKESGSNKSILGYSKVFGSGRYCLVEKAVCANIEAVNIYMDMHRYVYSNIYTEIHKYIYTYRHIYTYPVVIAAC